jgi:hypothetical protein
MLQPSSGKESDMTRFGRNELTTFSVPLAFEGRYFILEHGDPPRVSVVREHEGSPVFEVIRNEPGDAPMSEVTKTSAGMVAVSDKAGKLLYKVRPQDETSVILEKADGSEVSVLITDQKIRVGVATIKNARFNGAMAGIVVWANGGVGLNASIPSAVLHWLCD